MSTYKLGSINIYKYLKIFMKKWKWSSSVVSNSLWPMDYSLPCSSIHGIFQARILEWVAISFSRGSSDPGIELGSPTGVQTLGIMEFSLPRLVRVLPRNRTNRMCITCIYDVCMYVGLPWWLSDRESACQCNTCRFNPWVRRSSGEGNGNPLQYSCLGSPMDRGAWWAIVHVVPEESDAT